MVDFMKLKRNASEVLNAQREAAKQQTKGGQKDERFWKPHFDKEKGVGSAVIRLLPSKDVDDLPWVQLYHRSFKGPTGKWYIENDLRTLGKKDDPCYDLTRRLYSSGIKSDEEVAKPMKQKVKYICNVLIISDPSNRENEGKVKLYDFGSQIFDIIQSARDPKFEGEVAIDPFNPWFGADMKIRIEGKKVGNDTLPQYDKTIFAPPGAMRNTDEEIIAVLEKTYSLKEFVSPDKFKTADELRTILFDVLGPYCGSGVETVVGWGETATARPPRQSNQTDRPSQTPSQAGSSFTTDDDDLDAIMSGKTTQSVAESKVEEKEDTSVPFDVAEQPKDEKSPPPQSDDDMDFLMNLMNGSGS